MAPAPKSGEFCANDFSRTDVELLQWQQSLRTRSADSSAVDATIQVCFVPDLLTAECFSALCAAIEDNSQLEALDDLVIRAALLHTFQNWVSKAELASFLLSAWGLGSFIAQDWILHMYLREDEVGARSPAVRFLAARGIVDLLLEVFELLGLFSIGRSQDYLTPSNLFDLTIAVAPVYLFIEPMSRLATGITLALYWSRLLGVSTCVEVVGQSLLPIQNLVYGLGPALTVTATAFAAFTHILYKMQGGLVEDVVHDSFVTLLTGGIPDADEEIGALMVHYAGVYFFTVFILNILIWVIGELYGQEKERARLSFARLRANRCLRYFLRVRVMPCIHVSKVVTGLVFLGSFATAVAMQIYAFEHWKTQADVLCQAESAVYVLCQGLMVHCAFHVASRETAESVTKGTSAKKCRQYLWVCTEDYHKPRVESDPFAQLESRLKAMDSRWAAMEAKLK